MRIIHATYLSSEFWLLNFLTNKETIVHLLRKQKYKVLNPLFGSSRRNQGIQQFFSVSPGVYAGRKVFTYNLTQEPGTT